MRRSTRFLPPPILSPQVPPALWRPIPIGRPSPNVIHVPPARHNTPTHVPLIWSLTQCRYPTGRLSINGETDETYGWGPPLCVCPPSGFSHRQELSACGTLPVTKQNYQKCILQVAIPVFTFHPASWFWTRLTLETACPPNTIFPGDHSSLPNHSPIHTRAIRTPPCPPVCRLGCGRS